MIPGYPQWPGFPMPYLTTRGRAPEPLRSLISTPAESAGQGSGRPDHHTQLEDLLGHVRRCERWAALDDRLDLWIRNQAGLRRAGRRL